MVVGVCVELGCVLMVLLVGTLEEGMLGIVLGSVLGVVLGSVLGIVLG